LWIVNLSWLRFGDVADKHLSLLIFLNQENKSELRFERLQKKGECTYGRWKQSGHLKHFTSSFTIRGCNDGCMQVDKPSLLKERVSSKCQCITNTHDSSHLKNYECWESLSKITTVVVLPRKCATERRCSNECSFLAKGYFKGSHSPTRATLEANISTFWPLPLLSTILLCRVS
jgi:hypothetical protein